jgi:hypothetical protein
VVTALYWFHAFTRQDAKDYLDVLREGPVPPPVGLQTDTKKHEILLDLEHSVYAYLGRTLEAFGKAAVVLNYKAPIQGKVSPFDTGGLVNKIKPVCQWEPEAKKQYVKHLTWSFNQLPQQLKAYPGQNSGQVKEYIEGACPSQSGPHDIWDHEPPVAEIWTPENHWRAWIWEIRSSKLPTGKNLAGWACDVATFQKILAEAEEATEQEQEWYQGLMSLYVDGGVSGLVQAFQARQLAA